LIDIIGDEAKSETGCDGYHAAADPLWANEQVQRLLHGRPKRDENAKKRARKEYNAGYYKKAKAEKARLENMLANGEISQSEFGERVSKWTIGWYKTVAEALELGRQYDHFLSVFRKLYAKDPPNKNPLPYDWPTTPSVDAYIQIACLCLPVARLVKIDDPTHRSVQITLKTALSTDKDYMDQWIPPQKREAISAVFNSSCDLIQIKLNSLDRAGKRDFFQEWKDRRDGFIFSLTGTSTDVPPVALLNLVALAWKSMGESEENDEGIAVDGGETS